MTFKASCMQTLVWREGTESLALMEPRNGLSGCCWHHICRVSAFTGAALAALRQLKVIKLLGTAPSGRATGLLTCSDANNSDSEEPADALFA